GEQVSVEGGVLGQQTAQIQGGLDGDELVQTHLPGRDFGPGLGGAQSMVGVGAALAHGLEDHRHDPRGETAVWSSSRRGRNGRGGRKRRVAGRLEGSGSTGSGGRQSVGAPNARCPDTSRGAGEGAEPEARCALRIFNALDRCVSSASGRWAVLVSRSTPMTSAASW